MARQPDPIKYTFTADTSGFKRGTKAAADDLKGLERQAQSTNRQLDLDLDIDTSSLDLLRERLRATRAQLINDIDVGVDVDTVKAVAQLQRIERQLRSLDRMDIKPEVKVDVDRGLSGVTAQFDRIQDAMGAVSGGFAAMPPQAKLAAAAVAGIGAALAAPVVVGTIGGVLAGTVGKAGYELLSAFDEIEKSRRKAKIVFGKQLADVEEWAEGLSTKIGVGERAVVDAAAGIQDLLVPRGFSRAEAADITQAVYERGAALAEFSNRETADGIEAVTAALLGEREQLKSLGVQISESDVKGWLADNEAAVRGLSDGQAAVVATLALIEDRSVDAWTAFQNGAGTADEVLNTLSATFANVRDVLVEGFGGIFVGVVEDILGVNDALENLAGSPQGLADWIEENREGIRAFMLELSSMALGGAEAFLAMADGAITVTEYLVRAVPDMMRFAASAIDISEKVGALFTLLSSDIGSDQFKDAWGALTSDASDRVVELETSADRLEDRLNGWNLDPAREALAAAGEAVNELGGDIDRLMAADELRLELSAAVKSGDVENIKDELTGLTEQELEALIEVTDGESATRVEKRINKAAEKRLAEVRAYETNADEVERRLDSLTALRYATIRFTYYDPSTGSYSSGGNLPSRMAVPATFARDAGAAYTTRASGPVVDVRVPDALRAAPSVSIVNNYPEPERASDSLALTLRMARWAVG